eukprot:scaffold6153_cov71-Skeletonema_dohrnii-CCMP3373.AAC.2
MISFEVLESVSYLLGLIDARKWDTFRSYALEPSPAHFRARTDVIAQIPEFNGMTLLHAALKCDSPPELVLDMIAIWPDLLAARDCLGRTPLHVAAGSAADPRLIKILAHVCPVACDVQDVDGKTPLHFACDSSSVLFQDDHNNESATTRPPCHDAICALLSESLAAATIEDADEMSPLEHAIMSNASLKTVKLLQNAAVKHLQGTSSPGPTTMSLRRVTMANNDTSVMNSQAATCCETLSIDASFSIVYCVTRAHCISVTTPTPVHT